jgi:hypothetical protein
METRKNIPAHMDSPDRPDKEMIEGILREWLAANPDIDWVYKDNHAKDIEGLLGSEAHVTADYKTAGEFHIVFTDSNEKFMGVCEMYADSETFQWLQC